MTPRNDAYQPAPERGRSPLGECLVRLLFILSAVGMVCWPGCGNPTVAGGTDVGNPESVVLAGRVVDSSGKPQVSARVRIAAAGYNPLRDSAGMAAEDSTDSLGRYRFANIPEGHYTLDIWHAPRRLRRIVADIAVQADLPGDRDADTLLPVGTRQVRIPVEHQATNTWLYIPGTTIRVPTDSLAVVSIPSIPSDMGTIILYAPDTDTILDDSLAGEFQPDTAGPLWPADSIRDNVVYLAPGPTQTLPCGGCTPTDIAVDSSGTVWIATEKDSLLLSYDGTAWTTHSLAMWGIETGYSLIAADERIYLETGRSLLSWTTIDTDPHLLPLSLDDIALSPRGHLYGIEFYGVYTVKDTGIIDSVAPPDPTRPRLEGLAVNSDGVLWAGTTNGVYRIAGRAWTFHSLPPQDTISGKLSVAVVGATADGHIWTTTSGYRNTGVAVFDGSDWDSRPRGIAVESIGGGIVDVATASDGVTWIATHNGIIAHDGHDYRIMRREAGLDSAEIYAVAIDRERRVWVVHETGVAVWDGRRWLNYLD